MIEVEVRFCKASECTSTVHGSDRPLSMDDALHGTDPGHGTCALQMFADSVRLPTRPHELDRSYTVQAYICLKMFRPGIEGLRRSLCGVCSLSMCSTRPHQVASRSLKLGASRKLRLLQESGLVAYILFFPLPFIVFTLLIPAPSQP